VRYEQSGSCTTYLGGEEATQGRDREYIEYRGADYGADPQVALGDEGADDVDEELGARGGSGHEGRARHVLGHPDSWNN
jgi:hypothetical protein